MLKVLFFNKHYGKILALLYFIPVLIRIIFRMCIYKLLNSEKFIKYYCRWDGLRASILRQKSYMRPEKILNKVMILC